VIKICPRSGISVTNQVKCYGDIQIAVNIYQFLLLTWYRRKVKRDYHQLVSFKNDPPQIPLKLRSTDIRFNVPGVGLTENADICGARDVTQYIENLSEIFGYDKIGYIVGAGHTSSISNFNPNSPTVTKLTEAAIWKTIDMINICCLGNDAFCCRQQPTAGQ